MAAREALKVSWSKSAAAGFDSEATLQKTYHQVHADPAAKTTPLDQKGDAKAAFAGAAKTFKSEFYSDYGYHAQMEPLNAVARLNAAGDQIEVWEGTQDPGSSRQAIAKALGFKPEQVTLHQCYMGGGFGRRSLGDYAAEAAVIAREAKRPVKLVWTRDEDMQYGMFRPQAFQCLEAALDKDGRVNGWTHCVVGDGGVLLQTGIRIPYYGVPNQYIESRGVPHGIRLKHWRARRPRLQRVRDRVVRRRDGVGRGHGSGAVQDSENADESAWAGRVRESRADVRLEGAAAAGARARHLDQRALGLARRRRGRDLARARSGKIRVHKTWLAVDGGLVVQPGMARANVESGIVYGLSSVLHERVTLKDGVVQQSNFHDYHVMRMSDMPEVMEVAFVERDAPPSGLGEIGNPWVAAAVANAFHRLTGKRLKHMPFTPARVQEALKA